MLTISSMDFLCRKYIFDSNEMDSRHVPGTRSVADVDDDRNGLVITTTRRTGTSTMAIYVQGVTTFAAPHPTPSTNNRR